MLCDLAQERSEHRLGHVVGPKPSLYYLNFDHAEGVLVQPDEDEGTRITVARAGGWNLEIS